MAKRAKRSTPKKSKPASTARPSRRRLQPRTRDYDFSRDAGGGATGGPPDDMTLKPGAPASLYRLKFTAGPTVARIVPMLKAENPEHEWDPWRMDTDENGFSDFIRRYPIAKWFGVDTQRTFLLYDVAAAASRDYDPKTNPYRVLYNALKSAADDSDLPNQAWGRLIKSSRRSTTQPPIQPPAYVYFVQAILFEHGGKPYASAEHPPIGLDKNQKIPVLQLSQSAGRAMAELFNEIDQDSGEYAYGDPIDLAAGKFIRFYNPKRDNPINTASAEIDDVDDGEEVASWDQVEGGGGGRSNSDNEFRGYECEILDSYPSGRKKIPPRLDRYESTLRDRVQFWSDILHIPCHDEICKIIAIGLQKYPKVLEFAWQDHREFFTDEVRGILGNRLQVPVPGQEDDEEELDEWRVDGVAEDDDDPVDRDYSDDDDDDDDEAVGYEDDDDLDFDADDEDDDDEDDFDDDDDDDDEDDFDDDDDDDDDGEDDDDDDEDDDASFLVDDEEEEEEEAEAELEPAVAESGKNNIEAAEKAARARAAARKAADEEAQQTLKPRKAAKKAAPKKAPARKKAAPKKTTKKAKRKSS